MEVAVRDWLDPLPNTPTPRYSHGTRCQVDATHVFYRVTLCKQCDGLRNQRVALRTHRGAGIKITRVEPSKHPTQDAR